MPSFRETAVDDPAAQRLLVEYFESRELGFVGGDYVTVFPTAATFAEPNGVFLVVESDGADVGCGGIRVVPSGPSGLARYEVKHLFLEPQTRGQGLGRALLVELERRARELGAGEIALDTNASLEAAAGLYRSTGYESIEPYNDNPNANVWLRKVLPKGETVSDLPENLTLEEAFRAALFMVEIYGDVEKWRSDDIALLHQYMLSDPARWSDWQNAVGKAIANPDISPHAMPRD